MIDKCQHVPVNLSSGAFYINLNICTSSQIHYVEVDYMVTIMQTVLLYICVLWFGLFFMVWAKPFFIN